MGRKVLFGATVVPLLCTGGRLVAARYGLAITEVMSSATDKLGTNTVLAGPDFFELTNFGTNEVDLTRFKLSDAKNVQRPLLQQWDSLRIQPNESVVFVRSNSPAHTEVQFRTWWGVCLSADTRIRFYLRPGWSSDHDGVRLYDETGRLVDRVDFGMARPGVSFVYDTNCGGFGVLSSFGVCGTCRAESADDIGSPGRTRGPVPLSIRDQPTDVDICAGMPAAFRVGACGLPRPTYRWFFNGTVLSGETAPTLIITNSHPTNAGLYYVEISNGREALSSSTATLTVSTNLSPPLVVIPPSNFEVYTGQTARFSVTVCAFPVPSYQWYSNGVPLAGADGPALRIGNCTLGMSGAIYCVLVTNSLGSTSLCAKLTVIPKPDLRVTEIMASPLPQCLAHLDWFELTNYETNLLDLCGYRFSDEFSFESVQTITESLVIGPGESVVFAERMDRETFLRWWGVAHLPPMLKIVTYAGFGFNALMGDGLYLWNGAAEDPDDAIDGRSFAIASPGVSLYYDLEDCYTGCDSQADQLAAFQAVECGDVGSPGWVPWTRPSVTSLYRAPAGVVVSWRAPPGSTNLVQYTSGPDSPTWTLLGSVATNCASRTLIDTGIGTETQRCYRVMIGPNGPVSDAVVWPAPTPRLLGIAFPAGTQGGPTLTWAAEPHYTYVLEARSEIESGAWTSLATNLALTGSMTVTDTNLGTEPQRFYRVVLAP